MNKSHYIKIISIIALASICIFGAYGVLWNTMLNMAQTISSDTTTLVANIQERQYAQKIVATYATSQKDVVRIQDFFVPKGGEADLIEHLESLARSYTLSPTVNSVSLVSPTTLGDSHSVEYVSLQMSASGTWVNVWNFSRALEVLPYSVIIKSIAFIKGEDIVSGKITRPGWKVVATLLVLKKK